MYVNLAIAALLPSFGAREKWLSRVGRHWRDGSNGSALLLALDLCELPVPDQEIKTRAACVGLFVGPFDHAEFAIDEEFLALLNELAAILGGSSQYLEVDKSGDLLFLPLSVREVLVVGDGCRKLLPGAILHFW